MKTSIFENNLEIIAVVNSIIQSEEYNLSREDLFKVIENAFVAVAESVFGKYANIKAKLNRSNGALDLYRELLVKPDNENIDFRSEISLADAKTLNKDAQIGGIVNEPLPLFDFNDAIIRSFRTSIAAGVAEIERELEYERFSKLKGTALSGIVRRVSRSFLLVSVGKTEASISKKALLPQEQSLYKPGSKITAVIQDVIKSQTNPQVILSRTDKEFLIALLTQEIPEIADKAIEIKGIARDPGSRSKVAVIAPNRNLDPVGTCIGPRGKKIASITEKLFNERIDIVEWSDDIKKFAKECLKNIPVTNITFDEIKKEISIIVPKEYVSMAIGRKGQNVWLMSDLLKCNINILTEDEERGQRMEQFENLTDTLMSSLEIDEIIAQLLLSEGLKSAEDIVKANPESILRIEGFNQEIVDELISRAKTVYDTQQKEKTRQTQEINEAINVFQSKLGVPLEFASILVSVGLKSLQDVADLSVDELKDMLPYDANVEEEVLPDLIMTARKIVSKV